jgi:hypothetical protein
MRRDRITTLCAIVLSLIVLLHVPATPAFVDNRFATQVKLTQPIPGFGADVDIDGDTAAIAGSGSVFSDFPDGTVYVYRKEGTTWTLEQSLTAHDDEPQAQDSFGFSLALSGNTLVVGAMGDSTGGVIAGAAYVYVRDGHTWSLQQKLIAGDAADFAQFGMSVDINGDTVVIGAFGDDDSGYATGAAYVYHRDGVTWTEQQKLKASDEAAESSFGQSVSISGQTIAVGSPSQSSEASGSGAVYVFVNNGGTWEEQQKIKANVTSENQQLGFSVAISGDTIVATAPGEVVGAPSHDAQNVRSHGAAYIFQRTGTSWNHQKRFYERDTNRTGGFALRAAIDGDTIIVGDPTNDSTADFGGAIYVYVRNGNGWSLQKTLAANDAQFLNTLGNFIAISGDTVVAGAPNAGAAYIFQ